MRGRPSDGLLRRSLALVRGMRSRLESTALRNGQSGLTSPSRRGGAQRTRRSNAGATPLPRSLAPQAGDYGEEVGGSPVLGCRPDRHNQISDEEKQGAGRHGCWEHEKALFEVLPNSHLKFRHCRIGQNLHCTKNRLTTRCWWCQCPHTGERPPHQGGSRMEVSAEHRVGRWVEGKREAKERVDGKREAEVPGCVSNRTSA